LPARPKSTSATSSGSAGRTYETQEKSTWCRSVTAPCTSSTGLLKASVSEPAPPGQTSGKNGNAHGSGTDGLRSCDRARLPVNLQRLVSRHHSVRELRFRGGSYPCERDKILAVNARSGVLQKRRKLTDAWADIFSKPAIVGEVVPLRSAG
jgi:hypothetical protein